jgi:hypothetical protein
VRHFDPWLFDLLYDLTASRGDSSGEIDVICGYRTPWSNETCARAAFIPAWRGTACTCKLKLSTSAYRGFRPRSLGMRPCACIVEESVTIVVLTSCTSTSGVCASEQTLKTESIFACVPYVSLRREPSPRTGYGGRMEK